VKKIALLLCVCVMFFQLATFPKPVTQNIVEGWVNPHIPAPREDPNDLVGVKLFDTLPYLADAQEHRITWTNETGLRLLVKKSLLWTGVDMGARMDVHVHVERSDGTRMNVLGIDRYAEPVGPTVQEMIYDPYFAIEPGESLTLVFYAVPFEGKDPHARHEFDLWWQYASP